MFLSIQLHNSVRIIVGDGEVSRATDFLDSDVLDSLQGLTQQRVSALSHPMPVARTCSCTRLVASKRLVLHVTPTQLTTRCYNISE